MRKEDKLAFMSAAALLVSALIVGTVLLRSHAGPQTHAPSRGSPADTAPEPLPAASLHPVTMTVGTPNVSTAQSTLDAFCTTLDNRDYLTQYHLLSSSGQAQESLARYTSRQEQVENQIGGFTSCTGVIASESESSATCLMTITEGSGGAGEITCSLTKEDGAWKMNNIHPQ
jgi:hypothetical protein